MDTSDARMAVGRIERTTATPWAGSFWFVFTYLPPASLVGWESRMR